ncbi:MAG: protein kinase domain-containing protein [Gammaproteobacteria bacterium]
MATVAHNLFVLADWHTLEKDPYPGKELFWYRVTKVAGQNQDTITYFCDHRKENRQAVLKEYFPARLARRRADGMVVLGHDSSIADFNRGLEIFIGDAENLDRLNHPNIAKVLDVFETNGTGYMARGYEQGRTLEEMFASRVTFGESELREILRCILEGLAEIHKFKLSCRDLGAANIVVRPDGSAVLLVNVAVIGTSAHKPLWMPVSSLAAKVEQIDPWADMRAVGRILFRAVSGSTAVGARIKDAESVSISIPAVEAGRERYSQQFLQYVDHLLQPDPARRSPYTEKWYGDLAFGNVKSGKIQQAANTSSFEQQGVRWSHKHASLRELLREAVALARHGRLFAAPSAYLARMKLRERLHGHIFAVTAVLIAFSVALFGSIDRYRADTEKRGTDSKLLPDALMNWVIKIPIFYGLPPESNIKEVTEKGGTDGKLLPAYDALMKWVIKIPIFYGLPPESNTKEFSVLRWMSMGQPQHQANALPHPSQALPALNQNPVFNRPNQSVNVQYRAERGDIDPLAGHDARRANSRDRMERLQRPESLEIAVHAKRMASRNSRQSVVTVASQTRRPEHSQPTRKAPRLDQQTPPKRDDAEGHHQSFEGQPVTTLIEHQDSRLDKIEQTARMIRPENVDRGRAELPEPIERTERTERPEVARLDRPERSERIERAERLEHIERIERLVRPERIERLVRPERFERIERLLR